MPKPRRSHGIANRQRRARPRKAVVGLLVDRVLDCENEPRGLSVVFVGERTIQRLNRQWMAEDRPTDVLSFPLGDPPPGSDPAAVALGEVVICIAVCARQARERRVPLHDEVARMLIHGTLHVLGFDHARSKEAASMRARERRHLAWYRRRRLRVVEAP